MSRLDEVKVSRRAALGGAVAAGLCLGAGGLFGAEAGDAGLRPRVRPLPSDGKTPIPLLGLGCAERFPMQASAGRSEEDARNYAAGMIDYAL